MYLGKKDSVIVVLLVIVFISAVYLTLAPEKCGTFDCFQENMVKCSAAEHINEEPEASWGYKILGREGNDCEIEVTLLQAKEGELAISEFQGHSMSCFYPIGTSAYPHQDLSLCHGRLKEDIQGRIISKLHEYLLDNLIDIEKEFREALNDI